MAGKISDEALYEAEKRIKRCEVIIAAMTEEERSNPDLICLQVNSFQQYLSSSPSDLVYRAGRKSLCTQPLSGKKR